MFQCHNCGSDEYREILVTEVFEINGKHVLVENIPAKICARCEAPVFTRETTEKIRRMVHGESMPIKSVNMDVFVYA